MYVSLLVNFFFPKNYLTYTDLAYTLTMDTLEGEEFHILIIVFIILVAIFFCHSLARTCMLAARVAKYGTTFHHRVPSVAGPRGYAQPAEPIHVILARDEEEIIVGQQDPGPSSSQVNLTAPPPAYGLWRNSVVCSGLSFPLSSSSSCSISTLTNITAYRPQSHPLAKSSSSQGSRKQWSV